MYHPGKVLRVFEPGDSDVLSADEGTHAMVSMWDENLITVLVHSKLEGQVKEGDIVLVDYRPVSSTLPVPRFLVTKVLKGEHAAETWRTYKEKYKALKGRQPSFISSQAPPLPPQGYIG